MHAKCGYTDTSCHTFDKMAQRNMVTWNSMFSGYAENGRVDEAVNFFERMPERSAVSRNLMVFRGYFMEVRTARV